MSTRRIGNYQITDYVGSGGFGSVFKAEDVHTPGRIVAIKELHKKHTRNQVIKQRFFQEAVAMARLDHPNLPRLYSFGEDNGSYYLVMEFISGKLLSDELHDGVMNAHRAVAVLAQVLDALGYAHRNGIIHRDLKPDNIILVGNGDAPSIKVLDFGIARMVGGESLTLTGEGFGTPAYMAPERIIGAGGDDPRMDLYSAGIILFEMLSGKAPFSSTASDPALYWTEMRELHEREPLPSLAPLGVSSDLERVMARATAKRVEDRYQTADEMLADLENVGITATDVARATSASRLLLTTSPTAAEVYVDDVLRGTSDASKGKILIGGLAAGLHRVRVLKQGYNEYRINVALEEGRETDLQVALPARATVAMPSAVDTAAGGFETLKLQGADTVKTAMLVVESLPAGSTVFVGSEPVARAGEDGRATVKLSPGAYEIRASSPSGAAAMRVVTITDQDTGTLKTTTLPITLATVVRKQAPPGGRQPSRKGKQLAAAAAVTLLLALAATAYFVLRGPDRNRAQAESASIPTGPSAAPTQIPQEASSATQTAAQTKDSQQVAEDKKKAAEARRQAELEKKAASNDSNKTDKDDRKDTASAPAVPVPPSGADALPEALHHSSTPNREACVIISVTDAAGQPAKHLRVAIAEQSEGAGSTLYSGNTNEKGRWHDCGFTPGHRIRIAVLGPRGGMLGAQQSVVAIGRNQVQIQLQKKMDELPQAGPNRKRLWQRP
jgi:serine/threonine-protein kinase